MGSRSITDFVILDKFGLGALRTMGFDIKDVDTIVSGLAQGADMLGVDMSLKYRVPYLGYIPQWTREDGSKNKAAGFERNTDIVYDSDAAIVIWDGASNGTRDTMKKLFFARKPYVVITAEYLAYDEPRIETRFANINKWYELYEEKKEKAVARRTSPVRKSSKR